MRKNTKAPLLIVDEENVQDTSVQTNITRDRAVREEERRRKQKKEKKMEWRAEEEECEQVYK